MQIALLSMQNTWSTFLAAKLIGNADAGHECV